MVYSPHRLILQGQLCLVSVFPTYPQPLVPVTVSRCNVALTETFCWFLSFLLAGSSLCEGFSYPTSYQSIMSQAAQLPLLPGYRIETNPVGVLYLCDKFSVDV